jgi:uncharacterized protein (TIGR02246 family)
MTGAGGQAAGLSPGDEAAIRGVIDAYQRTWNTSDLDGMGRLYSPDVHWVNVKGMHWRGFQEVDRAHRVFFDIMFRGVSNTLEGIDSITPIAPSVAVAVVVWQMGAYRTPDGYAAPAGRNRMTLVLTRRSDGWKIAHGHNIAIDEQAQPNDPIRGTLRPSGG